VIFDIDNNANILLLFVTVKMKSTLTVSTVLHRNISISTFLCYEKAFAKFLYSIFTIMPASLYIFCDFYLHFTMLCTQQLRLYFTSTPLLLLTYALQPAESLVCLRRTELCVFSSNLVSFSSCRFLSSSTVPCASNSQHIYCSPILCNFHNKICQLWLLIS
jgi:hypothetical protein